MSDIPITRKDLEAAVSAGRRFKYVFFWGHRKARSGEVTSSCFSQWYESPFEVDGNKYGSSEHFMMAAKARLFGDEDVRQRILTAGSPGAAKALGREVRNFDEATWQANRFDIVTRGNREKFRQNSSLGEFLKRTGSRILVEASPVDRIWGIGLERDHEHASIPSKWRGENLLGFALMAARQELFPGSDEV